MISDPWENGRRRHLMTPGQQLNITLGREEDWWQAVPHQDVIVACGPRAGGGTTCSINLGAAWLGSVAAWKSHLQGATWPTALPW